MKRAVALALLFAASPAGAVEPGAIAHGTTAADGDRSVNAELRVGAGIDTNVKHDPGATVQSSLLRLDGSLDADLTHNLKLGFVGWFDQRLGPDSPLLGPNQTIYDLNETSLQLIVMYRRPLTERLSLQIGSFSEFHRELTNWVEGKILTTGAQLLNDVAEHTTVGIEAALGPFDLDVGGAGHAKYVWGTDTYGSYGVDGHVSLRYLPIPKLALRLRYQFLFQDLVGFELRDLVGNPTNMDRNLLVYTNELDFTIRGRPVPFLDLFLRYEFADIVDNDVGYLSGQEHRVLGGLRFDDERRWVVDFAGRMVARNYPYRIVTGTIDNQQGVIEIELLADAELWLVRYFGIFARYQFNLESANPFGLIYTQHMALLGVGGRVAKSW